MFFFRLFFICISSCLFSSGVFAASWSDIHRSIVDIQLDLYHQKFDDVEYKTLNLMSHADLSEITQMVAYQDFLMLMEFSLIRLDSAEKWSSAYRTYYKLLDLRKKYFPKDAKRAAYQYYRDPRAFFLDCTYHPTNLTDTVYTNWCMMENVQLRSSRKKQIWKNILSLYQRSIHSKNLTDLGTIGFVFQRYGDIYSGSRADTLPLLLVLGKRMVEIDPHWMNGYSILVSVYEKESDDYRENIRIGRENYIGDSGRLDRVMKDIDNQ